ncbi:MAG: hypothetical protein LQ338_001605 [Usnochroma carphineum]|nr:MAG: hypothetical protein LQ338_001605 [Usnochroma carphineum]
MERDQSALGESMSKSNPLTFQTLPGEIRAEIYRMALIVNGVINPYPAYFQPLSKVEGGQDLPQVALLQTCRQIRAEALPTLYGQNTWRLNVQSSELDIDLSEPLGAGELKEKWIGRFWKTRAADIRHVVTGYDMRDVSPEHQAICSQVAFHEYRSNGDYATDELLARRELDDDIFVRLQRLQNLSWDRKMGDLLSGFTNMTTLTLVFQNCYHPSGFSRSGRLKLALNGLAKGLRHPAGRYASLHVTVVGLKHDERKWAKLSCPGNWRIVGEDGLG